MFPALDHLNDEQRRAATFEGDQLRILAGAGTALVVLRVRGRHRARKHQSSSLLQLAERTLQDFAEEARRVLPDR